MKLKPSYYIADALGIYQQSAIDESQAVIDPWFFFESIEDLEEGQTICAYFDEEQLYIIEAIENEYGIKCQGEFE